MPTRTRKRARVGCQRGACGVAGGAGPRARGEEKVAKRSPLFPKYSEWKCARPRSNWSKKIRRAMTRSLCSTRATLPYFLEQTVPWSRFKPESGGSGWTYCTPTTSPRHFTLSHSWVVGDNDFWFGCTDKLDVPLLLLGQKIIFRL